MTAIKDRIIDKLSLLEMLSEPALREVLEFVSYLEWRLVTNKHTNFNDGKTSDSKTTAVSGVAESQADTSTFLLGLATAFSSGLSDEELARLPTDGAEQHDRYLYDKPA